MTKPSSQAQHDEWIKAGTAYQVKVPPPNVFRGPGGDLYGQDDKGRFWDGHIKGMLGKIFFYGNAGQSFLKKLGRILLGAAGVLLSVRNPKSKALGKVVRFFGGAEKAVIKVDPFGPRFKVLTQIADIVGWSELEERLGELEETLADGQISQEEFRALVLIRDKVEEPGMLDAPKEPAKMETIPEAKKEEDPPVIPATDPALEPAGASESPAPDPAPESPDDPTDAETGETGPAETPAGDAPEEAPGDAPAEG